MSDRDPFHHTPILTTCAQVRSLHVASLNTIISGSRDSSAIVWRASKDAEKKWEIARTIGDPDGRFVSSVGSVVIGGECE